MPFVVVMPFRLGMARDRKEKEGEREGEKEREGVKGMKGGRGGND